MVEELSRWARAAKASRRCARSRTIRRTSSASASRSCRTRGCPRRSRTDCVGCPLFRTCGQYAMALPLRGRRCGRRAASGRPRPVRADRAAQADHRREPRRHSSCMDLDVARSDGRRHRAGRLPRRRRRTAASRRTPASSTWRCSSPTTPASAAGVFTTNQAMAAPVLVSQEHLAATGGRARAIVINSGCANACTGDAGHEVARADGAPRPRAPSAASRGGAGRVDRRHRRARSIRARSTPGSSPRRDGAEPPTAHADAARAIMTTDPFPKEHAVEVDDRRRASFRVGGMGKGSGMIEPRMATMLGFLTTDAAVDAGAAAARADRRLRRHLQRHHRRRRVLDQRLRVRAGQRRQRRRDRRGRLRRARRGAARASATSWRWASSAAAKARPSWSPSR